MLAAGRALTIDDFLALFEGSTQAPDRAELRTALDALGESLDGRAVELVQVASGYRLQVRKEYSAWLGGLFAERPPRYSRALLETLALIAYRQPITRGEIEDVRGVAVSSNIVKTLMEREWVRVLGHREVPGRPALFGTTREFLDHFGLKSLDGLPPLAEVRDLDGMASDLFSSAADAAREVEAFPGERAAGEGLDGGSDDDRAHAAAGEATGDVGGGATNAIDALGPGAGPNDGETLELGGADAGAVDHDEHNEARGVGAGGEPDRGR